MKTKSKLLESLEVKLLEANSSINLDNIFQVWTSQKYGALSVVLANLRALYIIHQQHHWQSVGVTSYEDHLLFQRIYEATADNIDDVAEKCVGLDNNGAVNVELQVKTMWQFIKDNNTSFMPLNNSLVQKSLNAEYKLLAVINAAYERLISDGLLTKGLDNLLAGILDVHETHVYLLKQRLTNVAQVGE